MTDRRLRQHLPACAGRGVLIEGVLRVVERDSPVRRNPGTFVSATRRLITPTNASVTFFYGAASRPLLSCSAKPSRADSVRRFTCPSYKCNEPMSMLPGGQREYSIEVTG